jgi:hypothetical protein
MSKQMLLIERKEKIGRYGGREQNTVLHTLATKILQKIDISEIDGERRYL